MGTPGLDGSELMAWVNSTSTNWKQLFSDHPEAVDIPCDIRETHSSRELLQHIVAVELRYAQRLSGLQETPYEDIAVASLDALYAVHERAMLLLSDLSSHDENWWNECLEFQTRSSGMMRAPRRMIFVHLLMHSIRHYAQPATLMRRHGISPQWMMDYLGMSQQDA